MDRKICLDTDTVIAILNGEERAAKLIEKIENLEVFITTITLFELLLRENKLEQIEEFREKVGLLDFDELSSRKASTILKSLRKKGKMLDFRDLFIGSICITNKCILATFNKKHFERLKDFELVVY